MSAEQLTKMYAGLWPMYGRPCTKCGPFLIGLLLGFVTSNVNFQLDVKTARRTVISGLAFAIFVIYAILPEYWYPEAGNTLYNTIYTALFRTLFASAIAVVIGALFYSVERIRISYAFAILAKLTFNVYLLHMPAVYVFNHVSYLQTTTSAYVLVILLPFVCALSFLAALIFYLFVESPIGRLSGQVLKVIS
jgi:peptidoglycan/LPS O-acetylase OafA/YrhL